MALEEYQFGIGNDDQWGIGNDDQWIAALPLLNVVGYWITKPGNQYFITTSENYYQVTKDSNQYFETTSK